MPTIIMDDRIRINDQYRIRIILETEAKLRIQEEVQAGRPLNYYLYMFEYNYVSMPV